MAARERNMVMERRAKSSCCSAKWASRARAKDGSRIMEDHSLYKPVLSARGVGGSGQGEMWSAMWSRLNLSMLRFIRSSKEAEDDEGDEDEEKDDSEARVEDIFIDLV